MGTESEDVKVTKKSKAMRLVKKLMGAGFSAEHIAAKLDVSLASVHRWRDGTVAPQTGRLSRLEEFASKQQKRA